jgi:hypothetical protein
MIRPWVSGVGVRTSKKLIRSRCVFTSTWYDGDMCGRMTMATEQELFEARFHATATETIEKRYNAYPNHDRYTLYYMDWTNAPEKLVSNKIVFPYRGRPLAIS